MATPITWRNVNSDSNSAANALLAQAGQTFGNALDSFGKVATGLQKDAIGRQEELVKKNTNDFLNAISRYTSPEQLQQAQAEGVFRNMLTGYGKDIDQAAVRNAAEERLGILQQQTLNGIKVGDAQYQQKAQPIIDAYKAAVLNNKDADAALLLKDNPWLRDQAGLIDFQQKQDIFEADQARKGELAKRADEQFGWARKNQEINSETNKLQLDAAKEGKTEKDRLKNVEAELAQGINKYVESQKGWLFEASKRAQELGFGSDLDALTPEQANILKDKLSAPQYGNETAFVNDLLGGLSKKYGLKASEQLQASKVVDGLLTSANTPRPADKQAQEKRAAALDAEYANNIFNRDALATPEDLSKILGGKEKLNVDTVKELNDLVTKGFVASEGGNAIPITKSMLTAALAGTPNDYWFDHTPKEVLEKLFTDNKMGEAYQEHLQYKALKKSLEYSANTNPAALLQNFIKKVDEYQKKNLKM